MGGTSSRVVRVLRVAPAGSAAYSGENFVEVRFEPGDTAARLAERLRQDFPRWGVADVGQLALYRVPGGREHALAVEADPRAAAGVTDKANKLAIDDRLVAGAWVLARVAPRAALDEYEPRVFATLVAAVTVASRRAELARLFIPPTFSVASSGSGVRSPKSEPERFALKVATIEYYGLWDPATANAEFAARRVFTMLAPAGDGAISVAFKDAILAHIWPSSLAGESDAMRRLLGLPVAFHLAERNFLVLDKAVENAFDADALLLLPARAVPPAPPRARARAFRVGDYRASDADGGAAARAAVAALAGRELLLPRAAEGRVPFMRLLAWKAVSALRAGADFDDDAAAAFPAGVDVDATLERGTEGRARGARGFAEVLSAGLVFGYGGR